MALALALAFVVAPARGQDMPAYRDDRSDPQALIESLYNAVARKEYARAWSYFDEEAVAPFDAFAAGYADTQTVRLRVESVASEGAAGSLYGSVAVTLEAAPDDGAARVFTGCYETRLVQPAAQIEPPFRPLRIVAASLEPSADSFETAAGRCPDKGL